MLKNNNRDTKMVSNDVFIANFEEMQWIIKRLNLASLFGKKNYFFLNLNFMAPFLGWGSTASRLEPL